MNRQTVIFAFFALWPCLVFSAEAPSDVLRLGLRDTLVMARERHAEIIMADERVNQALARLGQAASGLLPQLRGVVSGSRQTRDLRVQGIALPGDPHIGPFNAFDARLKMTQAIFDPSAIARLDAASKGKQLSIAERRKVDEDVLALVATLYINARESSEHLKAQGIILKGDQYFWQTAQAKLRQGTASAIEVDQAKSRYEQSSFDWQQAQTQETQARLELCAALDLPFEKTIEYLNDEPVLNFDDVSLTSLNEHPDIFVAENDLKLKAAQHGLERSEWFPQISALADYGASGESPDESSRTYTVGIQATIPIWEGGNRENRMKETASRMKESQINLEEVKRETRARVLTAVETIKQAQAFTSQAQAQMNVANREAQLAFTKFKLGNGSRLDIFEGLSIKAEAHSRQAQALATYQLAQVNLAHAMGRMQGFLETQQQ